MHGRNFTSVHNLWLFLFFFTTLWVIYMCVWDEKYAPARMSLLFSFLPVYLSSGHGELELYISLFFFPFFISCKGKWFPSALTESFPEGWCGSSCKGCLLCHKNIENASCKIANILLVYWQKVDCLPLHLGPLMAKPYLMRFPG